MTFKELTDNVNYEKIDSFSHNNVKHVVMKELGEGKTWAKISNMYQITGLLAVVIGGFKAFIPFIKRGEFDNLIGYAAGLLFSATLLIVLHETIHALAYKYVGAKNLTYGMRIRRFLFFVLADKQVLNYHQFKIVALSPVIFVALATIVGMIFTYNLPWFYAFLCIFGIHSLFCGGDFGLLSYFENRKEKEILTFDIKEEGKTYFYAKKKF